MFPLRVGVPRTPPSISFAERHIDDPFQGFPVTAWDELALYLRTEFHNPDLQALRIVMSAGRAQYLPGEPVWLFVIGPSGSGKTSVAINCLSSLPNTWVESNLTPRTFLSCAANGDENSLLKRIGSGILAFKDFTTMLTKNPEQQAEIISQLREIYDGGYKSKTGVKWQEWEGKLTVIAAVTPAIERAWLIHRELGERFLQVRWPNGDARKIAEVARYQRGREKQISTKMRSLAKAFYDSAATTTPRLSDEQGTQIEYWASATALLRAHVVRDSKGSKRTIIDTAPPEEPTRIVKSLETVAVNHAALMNRKVNDDDMAVAYRVSMDSIASKRSAIIQALPLDTDISLSNLTETVQMAKDTIQWHLEELEAIGVVKMTGSDQIVGNRYSISSNFSTLWTPVKAISTQLK